MQQVDGQSTAPATGIRYQIIGWATIMSLLLYLDRFCISICTNFIRQDLNVDPMIVGRLSTAFFFAYALAQVPSGWLTDKFGVRLMLSSFILAWSACTGLQAFAKDFALLAILQLCCGMAQAGAYPAGARLIRAWNPPSSRGIGSAMVALGGRVGGAMAPILTAWMLVMFVPPATDSHLTPRTVLKAVNVGNKLMPKAELPAKPRPVDEQTRHLWQSLTESEQTLIAELGQLAKGNEAGLQANPSAVPSSATDEQVVLLRGIFNRLIDEPKWYRPELFDSTIEREGQSLSKERQQCEIQNEPFPPRKLQRLNRLALESTFGKDLGNVYVSGWRPSMMVYGVIGIVIAGLFWWQVQDTPAGDPRCNESEQRLILSGAAPAKAGDSVAREPFPWSELLTNYSLWGNCLLQITTNIGWVFLVRTMPQYLEEVHQVPLITRGWMTSVPIWTGVIAVFFGGRLTDWLGLKLGLKWGRRLPLLITRVTAAMGYFICVALSLFVPADQAPAWMPWVYVAALSLVAISTDIGVPAVWAYMQDVGGKYTASVLGWGNMWGNFGAAAATEIYSRILGSSAGPREWNLLFVCLGGTFLLGAVGAWMMDSSKPLVPVRNQPA